MVLMRVSTWLLVGLLLAGATAGAAAGEGDSRHRSKWWQVTGCKSAVGLTDAQSADLERIFQSMLTELRSEKADLERHEKELSRLLSTNGASEATVVRAIDRVEAARSALAKTRTLMLYRMRRVLSPEQRVRLDAYHKEQERAASSDTRQNRPF